MGGDLFETGTYMYQLSWLSGGAHFQSGGLFKVGPLFMTIVHKLYYARFFEQGAVLNDIVSLISGSRDDT